MQSTHVWKWPVVKYKYIKIKRRICILFILCLTWTVNANSLKQNIVIKYVLLSCHLGLMNRRRFCLQQGGSQEHICEFHKSKMAEAAILKTVKSPYLCNRLADFDEIWHVDAHWPPTADRPLKFRLFENPKWRRAVPPS